MQIHCYRCGWNFPLTQEELAFASEAVQAKKTAHYDARCPRCRAVNKVPAEQIRRAAPRPAPPPTG
jgi:hypothetical protein